MLPYLHAAGFACDKGAQNLGLAANDMPEYIHFDQPCREAWSAPAWLKREDEKQRTSRIGRMEERLTPICTGVTALHQSGS